MTNEEEYAVLNDCNNILYNVCDTNAEAHTYYMELVRMCNNGATEEQVYNRLKVITTSVNDSHDSQDPNDWMSEAFTDGY